MNDAERALAIEEIKKLKARYFRFFDTKDIDGFQSVFTADAELDSRQAFIGRDYVSGQWRMNNEPVAGPEAQHPAMRMTGWDAIKAGFESMQNVSSVHHGHMPEIEITSPTTATGTWAMEDRLRWPAGGWPPAEPYTQLHGYGHYVETYVKESDGQWRIKTLTLNRSRVEMM
jgi:hypothetical protein